MGDATSKRLDRLENKAQALGERVDVTGFLDTIAEAYGCDHEGGKVFMRSDVFQDLKRALRTIYGDKQEGIG